MSSWKWDTLKQGVSSPSNLGGRSRKTETSLDHRMKAGLTMRENDTFMIPEELFGSDEKQVVLPFGNYRILPTPEDFIEVQLTNKSCMYLCCTTQMFWYTTTYHVDTSIISHSYLCVCKCVVRTFTTCSHWNSMYTNFRWTVITSLYIRSLELDPPA